MELLHVYCPIRTTLNPAHTTQQLRVLTYPGVRVVVSVSMVTLVVVVGLVVVLSSAVCLYSGVCGGGGVRGRSVSRCTCVLNICHKQLNKVYIVINVTCLHMRMHTVGTCTALYNVRYKLY